MGQRDPQSTNPGDSDDVFECYNCGRSFRWREDISGRTLLCKCGSKVRCPELHDDTMTAQESLEDTVADVVLQEALDTIDTPSGTEKTEAETEQDVQELFSALRRHHGIFGLRLGGEVLLYGALSIVGIALAILAFILGKYFWWWIAAAVAIAPLSWWRFWHRWQTWSAGRSFMESLADVFGMREESEGAESSDA
jgi:DNA-directed RNA polymerase subunit RPC12/RpoP